MSWLMNRLKKPEKKEQPDHEWILTAALLNEQGICPGCGGKLGMKKTYLPVPMKKEERYRNAGIWYCGSCGYQLNYAFAKVGGSLIGVVCSGCRKKIHVQPKLAYVAGKYCCTNCCDRLISESDLFRKKEVNTPRSVAQPEQPAAARPAAVLVSRPAEKPRHQIEHQCVLFNRPASHGDAELSQLILEVRDGLPSVSWCVTWRGGYSHADGAGNSETIPCEQLAGLTPETLLSWMEKKIACINDLYDRAAFAKDEGVEKWCALIRKIYSANKRPVEHDGACKDQKEEIAPELTPERGKQEARRDDHHQSGLIAESAGPYAEMPEKTMQSVLKQAKDDPAKSLAAEHKRVRERPRGAIEVYRYLGKKITPGQRDLEVCWKWLCRDVEANRFILICDAVNWSQGTIDLKNLRDRIVNGGEPHSYPSFYTTIYESEPVQGKPIAEVEGTVTVAMVRRGLHDLIHD